MQNFLRNSVLVILVMFAVSAYAQPLRNGKWEVITQTIMPDISVPLPAHTDFICVKDHHKDKPPIAVHELCEFHGYKIINNTATWKMKCKGDMQMNGAGKITFKGDEYTGSGIVKMKMPQAEPMEIDHIYSGKWVGEC